MSDVLLSGFGAQNNLLAVLKIEDQRLLAPHMQSINVGLGQILYEPGDHVKYAYFPCGPTLVSFLVLLNDGRGVETALVGREGAVGGIISRGHAPAYCRASVLFPGPMLRLPVMKLEELKAQSAALTNFFARYSDCLLAQIFQSVACYASHTIEERTAKWLLAALDRTGDMEVPLSQEQLASMLGVGRSYVARVIGVLKARGILETMRGGLRVTQSKELAKLACTCNEHVKQHFETVLKGVYPDNAPKATGG